LKKLVLTGSTVGDDANLNKCLRLIFNQYRFLHS